MVCLEEAQHKYMKVITGNRKWTMEVSIESYKMMGGDVTHDALNTNDFLISKISTS